MYNQKYLKNRNNKKEDNNKKKITNHKQVLFWINSPKVLIDKDQIMNMWPSTNMSFNEKLNAVSRVVIVLCLTGFLLTMSPKILISGAITLGVLIFLYYIKKDQAEREGFLDAFTYVDPSNLLLKKMTPAQYELQKEGPNPVLTDGEDFYKLNPSNPLGNVLLPEIGDTPNRKPAPPSFDNNVEVSVNKNTQKMTQDLHPCIENLDKRLFHDLGDKFDFENSMIQFNTMPSTTIPNAQGAFAEFCYGNMESCKDTRTPGSCGNDPPRIGSIVG